MTRRKTLNSRTVENTTENHNIIFYKNAWQFRYNKTIEVPCSPIVLKGDHIKKNLLTMTLFKFFFSSSLLLILSCLRFLLLFVFFYITSFCFFLFFCFHSHFSPCYFSLLFSSPSSSLIPISLHLTITVVFSPFFIFVNRFHLYFKLHISFACVRTDISMTPCCLLVRIIRHRPYK